MCEGSSEVEIGFDLGEESVLDLELIFLTENPGISELSLHPSLSRTPSLRTRTTLRIVTDRISPLRLVVSFLRVRSDMLGYIRCC
jgi:hypothetical protein